MQHYNCLWSLKGSRRQASNCNTHNSRYTFTHTQLSCCTLHLQLHAFCLFFFSFFFFVLRFYMCIWFVITLLWTWVASRDRLRPL